MKKSVIDKRKQGFTLLEMLVVLVIMGLLAALIGPRLFDKVDKGKAQTAEVQIKMIKGALDTMRLDLGRFPKQGEGLSYLYTPPQDEKLRSLWRGPYLDEPVKPDPWGNPYQYQVPGRDSYPFALFSYGADGVLGGEGYNADVGYLPPQ
jgi:general secretion pathway protein G